MKPDKKNKNPEKGAKKRESLQERVHRHLNDIDSKITDDDIRNVKTELEIRIETNPEHSEDKEDTEEKEADEEKKTNYFLEPFKRRL